MPREKNPAAVALGKRRHEIMTAEQRELFFTGRDRTLAARTPAERSAISRRAAMTRRLAGPAWMRKKAAPAPAAPSAEPIEPTPAIDAAAEPAPALPPDFADLAGAIDELSDDLIEALAESIARM